MIGSSGVGYGPLGSILVGNGSSAPASFQPAPPVNVGSGSLVGVVQIASGGTGNPAAPSPWQLVMASSTSLYSYLPVGTAGQILTSGGGNAPTWQNQVSTNSGVLSLWLLECTGNTSVNQWGVLVGSSTTSFSSTPPGQFGTVLTAQGSSAPIWQAAVAVNSGVLSIALGGTGNTSVNQWGVLIGSSATSFSSTPPGGAGQVLTANGSSAPTWQTPVGTNSGLLAVTGGGTGTAALTQFGVAYGATAGAYGFTGPAQFGLVLTGQGSSAPVWLAAAGGAASGSSLLSPTFLTTYGNTAAASITGSSVTAYGQQAGIAETSGHDNTLIGTFAGSSITTGSFNTIIGSQNGISVQPTTGARNTLIGYQASAGLTAQTDVVAIGYQINQASTYGNAGDVIIGATAQGTATNGTNTTIASVVIGYGAGNGGAAPASIQIGAFAVAGAGGAIVIGQGVQTNFANCLVFGQGGNTQNNQYLTTTATGQITFGTSTHNLNSMYLGNGAVGIAAPANGIIQPTPVAAGNGNTAGAQLILSGGNSTGSGVGGALVFQGYPATGSSSSINIAQSIGVATGNGAWTFGYGSSTPTHIINGGLKFQGSNAGTGGATLLASSVVSYSLYLPGGQASGLSFLANDGQGNLSWQSQSGVTFAGHFEDRELRHGNDRQ